MRVSVCMAIACAVTLGCGRFGFDEMPPAPASTELVVDPFTTTSADFIDIPGATLTLPPAPGRSWLLLTAATLQSSSFAELGVEARYLVDGVERGLGGTQNTTADRPGPWQHFYVIAGRDQPTSIVYQLRDRAGGTAQIDRLRAVALLLPEGVDPRYAAVDAVQDVTSTTLAPIATFPITTTTTGDHIVLLLANLSDAPAMSDIYLEWRAPDGAVLVPELQVPRQAWQSILAIRRLTLPAGTSAFTLSSRIGGGTSQLQYARVVAIRTDAFASVDLAETRAQVQNLTATPVLTNQLAPAGSSTASSFLYLASQRIAEDCDNVVVFADRGVHFTIDSEDVVVRHVAGNCALESTYGALRLLDAAPSMLATSIDSASVGATKLVISDASEILLLGLP